MTVVFLNAGASSFPDPGNWNPVNKIECLGSGGKGANTYTPPLAEEAPALQAGPGNPGSGGGGGAYAYADNVAATFPVPVSIGAKNLTGTGIIDITSTWWKSTNTTLPDVVAAANGTTNNQSGLSFGGYQFHPQGFKGGDGAPSGSAFSGNGNGSGGGGAAGPKGAGTNGVQPSTAGGLGSGGAGNGNTISGGMAIGVGGANDSQWPPYGCGGGGAGGSGTVVTNGGPGGVYGAGGGGAGGSGATVGGSGQDGLMIITYVPFVPPPPSVRVMVMA
jgi:hypothetical protein